MKRLSGYPRWFFWLLIIGSLAVVLTGLLMIPTVLEFKFYYTMPWRLPGAQRLWVVAAHVLVGWVLLMQTGALWHAHMRAGWRKRLNRLTGVSTALLLCLLGLTGVGLYYLGSEQWQLATSVTHSVTGLLFGAVLVIHYGMGRAISRR